MKKLTLALLIAAIASAQTVDTNPRSLAAVTFANLGTPANGTIVYCSDCTSANPAAGSGSGAVARRENGAWNSGGGGGSTSIFSYSTYTVSESFPAVNSTGTNIGTHGWINGQAGSGSFNNLSTDAKWNGGVKLLSSTTSTSSTFIYLRGVSQNTAAGWTNLTSNTWRAEFLFRAPDAAATSSDVRIGIFDDPAAPTGTGGRNFLYLSYLQGTDTNWALRLDTGGTVTTPGGGCVGSAAPAANTYYILKMTGAGTATITVQLLPSTTDYNAASSGTDIFTACTVTLPALTSGYSPVLFVGNQASTASINLMVHGFFFSATL